MKFKVTQEQADIIKKAASLESAPHVAVGRLCLEPGWRYNTVVDARSESSLNIALVTDDPNWGDTDLSDYGSWTVFRQGVELTKDGHGVFDFYIRDKFDEDSELCGNLVVYVKDGEMVRIQGYGDNGERRWTKDGGFAR